MRRFILIFLLVTSVFGFISKQSHAATEAECAIWLCMPGGFPSGCGAAYNAFLHRIEHDMSPLPPLASCATGPNGVGTQGSYKLGFEAFEPCKQGYQRASTNGYSGQCFPQNCIPGGYLPDGSVCEGYTAQRKEHPHYIKIWVKGEYLGQYWY